MRRKTILGFFILLFAISSVAQRPNEYSKDIKETKGPTIEGRAKPEKSDKPDRDHAPGNVGGNERNNDGGRNGGQVKPAIDINSSTISSVSQSYLKELRRLMVQWKFIRALAVTNHLLPLFTGEPIEQMGAVALAAVGTKDWQDLAEKSKDMNDAEKGQIEHLAEMALFDVDRELTKPDRDKSHDVSLRKEKEFWERLSNNSIRSTLNYRQLLKLKYGIDKIVVSSSYNSPVLNKNGEWENGINTTVNFNFPNADNKKLRIMAFFYQADGTPLEDKNLVKNKFSSVDGYVMTQKMFYVEPQYKRVDNFSISVGLPNSELDLSVSDGHTRVDKLKYKVFVYVYDELVAESDFNEFYARVTKSLPMFSATIITSETDPRL